MLCCIILNPSKTQLFVGIAILASLFYGLFAVPIFTKKK